MNTLFLLIGIGLVAGGLWLRSQDWSKNSAWVSWGVLFFGLALFLITGYAVQQGRQSALLARLARVRWLEVRSWQLACLAASPLLALVATLAAGPVWKMKSPTLAVCAWVGGIILALAGSWRLDKKEPQAVLPRWVLAAFVGLVLGSFMLRAWNNSHIPVVLSGDEGSAGLSAVEFVKGNFDNIFITGWFSFPSMYFFLQSVPIAILGQTIPALRVLAALAGALTVGAVFLAGRAMFGNWAGWFGALFLLGFHFHNHFSRIGLNNIWDGLWFVLVLGWFWIGWQQESRRAFLFAGLALGLSQYFYVSGRVLFFLLLGFIIVAGLLDWPRLRRLLPDLLLMSIVCLAVFLPLAAFFISFPNEFNAPMNRVSIFGDWMQAEVSNTGLQPWQIVARQVWTSFQGFTNIPIKMWYDPRTPLLRPASATLFLLGVGLLLLKFRQTQTLLLGLWIVAFGVIGGLSESTPASQRYVAVAPAVAMVLGYGLAESAALLGRLWPRWQRVIYLLALILLLAISIDELRFYYVDYTQRADFGGDNNEVAQHLANYLQDKPEDDWHVFFFGMPRMGYYSFSTLPYLAPQIIGHDMNQPWGSADNPQVNGERLIFVFLPNHSEDLRGVMADYPQGFLLEARGVRDTVLYWLYEVGGEMPPDGSFSPTPYPLPSFEPAAQPFPGAYP